MYRANSGIRDRNKRIRHRKLQVAELYKPGGAYCYRGGFNFKAIFAGAVGFILYEAIAVFKLPVGGSLPALATAGLVYFLLNRSR